MSDLVIYTKTGCPYCAAAMKQFNDENKPFTEYNLSEMPHKKSEALEISGGRAEVPIIIDGDQVTIGFGGS